MNDEIAKAIDRLIAAAVLYGRANRLLDRVDLGGEMGYEDARDEVHDAKDALIAVIEKELGDDPR